MKARCFCLLTCISCVILRCIHSAVCTTCLFNLWWFFICSPLKVFGLHQLQPVSKLRLKWIQVKMRLLPQTSLTEILGTWSWWPWLGRSVAGRQRGQSVSSGTGESERYCQEWRIQNKNYNKKQQNKPQKPTHKMHVLGYWISTRVFLNQQVSSVFREEWTGSTWKHTWSRFSHLLLRSQ